jgi:peptidyl-prolyl cis-trans isomerase B (cyclophilin B)
MAKRRRKQQDPSDELEAAINDTSEERSSKKGKGTSSKRVKGRRAERLAKYEEDRKQRQMRLVLISVAIAAVVIIASFAAWYYLKPEEELGNPVVIMETSFGVIELELFMDECPITAGNFKDLTENGFYNNMVFHRIIKNFMIQSGDPNGDGTGGPGFNIEGEASALALKHEFGSISMANSGSPDTAGSQFFIVTNPDGESQLDGGYAVFGKVIGGFDVVERIDTQPVIDNGQNELSKPINPVHLIRVSIK